MTSNLTPSSSSLNANRPKTSRAKSFLILALIALLGFGGYSWYKNGQKSADANNGSNDSKSNVTASEAPVPVIATLVRQGDFDVNLNALGTVTPLNTVAVHSMVDGQVLSIEFKEGQVVNAGDLLAKIDPRPFEVQLTLASGQLARDQALLDNAQADLERYKTLLAQDSIAKQVVDTQESLVRQHKGAIQADQGNIDNANLQLKHTKVIAPISGHVGLRQVGPGNMVRASDPNGIVVITQLQPVGVVFTAPEDALPSLMKRLNSGDRISVDAYDRAGQEKLGKGWLLATDNQIDAATGTIKIKAEFPNGNSALFANQFVNVKMSLKTLAQATLVPSAAIQHGANGNFIYVVKDDDTVAVTPVKVGAVQNETTVINSGVEPDAKVVIEGADRLRDGAKVDVTMRGKPSIRKASLRQAKKTHVSKKDKAFKATTIDSLKLTRRLSNHSSY